MSKDIVNNEVVVFLEVGSEYFIRVWLTEELLKGFVYLFKSERVVRQFELGLPALEDFEFLWEVVAEEVVEGLVVLVI